MTGPTPSAATRNARKLIEQDKIDVLMGTGGAPASIAITTVCHELKVPCITLSPVNMPGEPGSWDDLDARSRLILMVIRWWSIT